MLLQTFVNGLFCIYLESFFSAIMPVICEEEKFCRAFPIVTKIGHGQSWPLANVVVTWRQQSHYHDRIDAPAKAIV